MAEDLQRGSIGTKDSLMDVKTENESGEERKMNVQIPTGFLGDQNDYSESMLLGQFPDNFDVSDACGWMNHDDFSDFQQPKRFDNSDGIFDSDNRSYNPNYAQQITDHQMPQQMSQQMPSQHVPQLVNQHGLGMANNNMSTKNVHNAPHNLNNIQVPTTVQTQQNQAPKVQDIVLSSSQYTQQLHEMHLHHLEQISHTTNSSEYYNRPLEGPRSVLPIDSMNHETGESLKDGNDSGDSSGDDSDFGDLEDGEEGDEGKRRKNASQQSAKAKNREHAKNTRIRKKHYIEALKESLKLLSEERDKIDRDRRNSLSRLAEQAKVRKQVLQTMFFYRASAETSLKRWGSILDENFQLVLPITPYRSFPPAEVMAGQRRVNGVEAMIVDTTSLSVMVQSIGIPHKDGEKVRVQYYSGPEDTIMTGDSFMCKWLLRTENAVSRGARYEVFKQGMIKAIFTPQNRMSYLELSFDVMSFMQQLRRASGKQDFQVVPNTVSIAREDACEARVITEACSPYKITFASQSWCDLFGYEVSKVLGQTCKMLQGKDTEMDRIAEITTGVKYGRAGSTVLTNYNSDGEKITILLKTYPLYTESALTHYLGVVEPVYSKFTENGSGSTSGHTTEGSTSSSLASPRLTNFQSTNPEQSFIHSLILPQTTGWVKQEHDTTNIKNGHHNNSNNSNNNNSSNSNSNSNSNNNSSNSNSNSNTFNNNNNNNNNIINNTNNNYVAEMRSQNQNQNQNHNQNQNQNQAIIGNSNNTMISNNIQQRDHNPLKERNNPRDDLRDVAPCDPSSQHYNQISNRNMNGVNGRTTPHNSTSQPQPNSYHQHHQHHQHQAPPLETELSRFPPQDATYKASNRQQTVPQSNSLPHQAISLQQSSQLQQQQQMNDFDLEIFSPNSPNPAPHKSSKPNSNFTLTASGVSNQNHQNLQTNINNNHMNNINMNNGNSNNSNNLIYNQFINNSHSTDIACDIDETESENCPATRIPEWCQESKISTPLSDNTSGVSNGNYSENESPSDQDKE